MTTYTLTEAQRQQLLDVSLASVSSANMLATKLLQSLVASEAAPSTSPTELTDREITDLYFGATGQTLRPADMFLVRLFAHAVEAAIKGGA